MNTDKHRWKDSASRYWRYQCYLVLIGEPSLRPHVFQISRQTHRASKGRQPRVTAEQLLPQLIHCRRRGEVEFCLGAAGDVS